MLLLPFLLIMILLSIDLRADSFTVFPALLTDETPEQHKLNSKPRKSLGRAIVLIPVKADKALLKKKKKRG